MVCRKYKKQDYDDDVLQLHVAASDRPKLLEATPSLPTYKWYIYIGAILRIFVGALDTRR